MGTVVSLSRSTATIDEDRLYISSGLGDIACLNAKNGSIVWSKKASEDNNATYGKWGIAESLIVHDNKVFLHAVDRKQIH